MSSTTEIRLQLLGLVACLLFPQRAQCFYNPSSGRWLTRDPIGEKGGLNLYGFVGNNAVSHIDPFGDIKVEDCGARTEQIKQAFKNFCKAIESSDFKCCVNHFNIPARLKSMCDRGNEYTVKCVSEDTGACSGACGWSLPGGHVIRVCPTQWTDPGCGDVGCTLVHELTHMMGHGFEKWPTKVHKCLGCP